METVTKELARHMPVIVASALDSEQDGDEGRLLPEHVEVWCNESGEFDIHTKDLAIIIWANEFPHRRATLGQRRDRIINDVHRCLSAWGQEKLQGFVWVLLQPAAFGEL